jgi:CTD small phosphatase-like protein 2
LDNIDRNKKITHRLYRQHTTPHYDYAIKDLKNLGRNLSRTIIIDNMAENFNSTTPLNGIWVQSWYNDMEDNVLCQLIPFLIEIVVSKIDVRLILTDEIKETIIY